MRKQVSRYQRLAPRVQSGMRGAVARPQDSARSGEELDRMVGLRRQEWANRWRSKEGNFPSWRNSESDALHTLRGHGGALRP